jgi:hypothetical protein
MSADLADLMERSTASMPVDTARLVNGGLERGSAEVRRRRSRVAGWATAAVAASVLSGFLVPRALSGDDTVPEPAGSRGSATLQLLPEDELMQRFAALLPGASTPVSIKSFDVTDDVLVRRVLTNADGATGLVQGDFSVSTAMTPGRIARYKDECRSVQPKVSPKDGTDCVIVPDGTIMIWDDTVPPEDPAGFAAGVSMSYAYFSRWDGAAANLWAYNTADTDVAPSSGAVPVLRTQELVDLVQRMEFYTEK